MADIILFKHHIYKDIIENSLNIVKKYIAEKNRIVVGGMAIDMALRLKNSKLYDDDEIPDYDFFSYEFHKDAYNIASIIIKNMGEDIDISVINAMHPSTMRVRVNYIVVADITYIPKNIYKKIPTLTYKDLTLVHPHFQFITQHLSLYSPFMGAPYETVLYRWKKDMERYQMLIEKYPIKKNIKFSDLKLKKYSINLHDLDNSCITGIGGAIFWIQKAIDMNIYKNINEKIFIFSESSLSFFIPSSIKVFSLYSSNYEEKMTKLDNKKSVDEYNSILDILQKRLHIKFNENLYDNDDKFSLDIEIIDSHNMLLSSYMYNNLYFANLQNIMSVLLIKYFFYDDEENKEIYLLFYGICYEILGCAIKKYIKTKDVKILPFFPSLEFYGKKEKGIIFSLMKQKFDKLKNKKTKKNDIILPQKYYFNKLKKNKVTEKMYKYNPEKYYNMDGKKL